MHTNNCCRLLPDEINFLYECSKLDYLTIKYMASCNGLRAIVCKLCSELQSDNSGTVDRRAKFKLYDLKLGVKYSTFSFQYMEMYARIIFGFKSVFQMVLVSPYSIL